MKPAYYVEFHKLGSIKKTKRTNRRGSADCSYEKYKNEEKARLIYIDDFGSVVLKH